MPPEAAAEAVGVDDVHDAMQCPDHPYRANPGGVCAFCLQEKLGKLVSSAPFSNFPHNRPLHSSSSSSSFLPSPASHLHPSTAAANPRRTRIPFLHKSKTTKGTTSLSRSKSAAARSQPNSFDTPRKRWFWSFLRPHSASGGGDRSRHPQSSKISGFPCNDSHARKRHSTITTDGISAAKEELSAPRGGATGEAAPEKVGRSRSVGCGSRSFSTGEFLERISTGLGDCTLRRVESHREGKAAAGGGGKIVLRRMSVSGPTVDDAEDRHGQQRARCGGIFGMAMAAPPCPAYWLPEGTPRTRGRGWGWAFASPIRALRPAAKGHVAESQELSGDADSTGSLSGGPPAGSSSSLVTVNG